MKPFLAAVACGAAFASTAAAQLSNYLGPGVMTGGVQNIGMRAGEQVDLRFFAGVNGIYDNGLLPAAVNSNGKLVPINGLYGIEAQVGAYGVHSWRTSQIGINYSGDFLHYTNYDYPDQTNQALTIGYTDQVSRRLYFNLQGVGGIYTNFLGGVPALGGLVSAPILQNPSGLLIFDTRTYFGEGDASMTYLFSARSSITLGGDGFEMQPQSSILISAVGYGAYAQYQYKLSRTSSIGARYQREYFQYPNFFGHTGMNVYTGFYAAQLGPHWTLSLLAGAYQTSLVGLQSVKLAPAVAALLGVPTTTEVFSQTTWLPAVSATLMRQFKSSNLTFSYARTVYPGNGVYLTSRADNALAAYSYTGIHRIALSISGGYFALSSVGQGIPPYKTGIGSAGLTYTLPKSLHLVARYDLRHQDIAYAGFRQNSYRVTLGLAYSPGSLPLSLW